MDTLYLDSAATTPVSRTVLRAMEPYFTRQYGNPSSLHVMGEETLRAITATRTTLARELGAHTHEIVFTSGATESNNLALVGLARAYPRKRKIIVSSIEHASILAPARDIEMQGYTLAVIPVTREGIIDYAALEQEIDSQTLVVSIMHVNNVMGSITDVRRIGELCKKKNVLFHTDAAQSFGKLPINVRSMHIDLLSASAHKIGGPKGIGLLYVREEVTLAPLILGGGQERGLRSGTENVPGIVGFAAALAEVQKKATKKIETSRDRLMNHLEALGGVINGSRTHRIFNTIHVSFPGSDASMLVARLSQKGIYVSVGSACDARGEKEDHVLKALGISSKNMKGSIRLTLSDPLSSRDIRRIVTEIKKAL